MGGPEGRKALVDEGFASSLRKIVEWSGPVPVYVGSPTGTNAGAAGVLSTSSSGSTGSGSLGTYAGRVPSPMRYHHHRIDEDKKLTDMARLALEWLEHGDAYSGSI